MAKEVFMPKLSSTMEVGTLLEWFKEEGDTVEVGEPLFEIMTDKINIEVEAYEEGTLLKRYYEENAEIPVNAVVGYIGEPDEHVPDTPPAPAQKDDSENSEQPPSETSASEETTEVDQRGNHSKVRATPAARKAARQHGVNLHDVNGSGARGRIHRDDVEQFASAGETQVKATPLANKVARDLGVDLGNVTGTGVNGKIYKDDVLNLQSSRANVQKQSEPIKLSGMRKVIGERMAQSAFSAPHVTLTSEADMSEVIQLRKQLLPVVEKQTGYRLSYTEIIVKAVAHTLLQHPMVNASLQGESIFMNDDVHIGVAVAVSQGLVVPVVKHADRLGLAELTTACKLLAQAARDNNLQPDDMSGGTFTVSNLGMYAVDSFTPIINQPEVAILGVGRINEKPVGIDGSIALRPMMTLSLSFDHRVIDGAPAAAFLTDLKHVLENPFELLV